MPSSPIIDGTGGNRGSLSCTLSTTHTNDLICVGIAYQANGSAPSITGISGGGLTYTKQATNFFDASGAFCTLDLWTAPSSGTLSSTTITATPSTSLTLESIIAWGVSGLHSTGSPYDPGVPTVLQTNTNPISSLTLVTQNPDDLLIYLSTSTASNGNAAPTGWSSITGEGGVGFIDIIGSFLSLSTATSTSVIASGTTSSGVAFATAFTADATSVPSLGSQGMLRSLRVR